MPPHQAAAQSIDVVQSGSGSSGRSAGLSSGLLALSALAAALPAITGGLGTKSIFKGVLVNPDSAMRLVRLNDIIASGQPLHVVLRDASGTGAVMSWSHLMDALLLLLAAPLAAVAGWPAALHAAGLAWSPLCMASLGIATVWAIAPVAPRAALWMAAIAVGLAPAVVNYGGLGIVHHHIPIAITAVMAAGWVVRLLRGHAPVAGGLALGAWAATGLWLSPEALPFALMAAGALGLNWLLTGNRATSLALLTAGCALLALVTLIWLADPPAGGFLAVEPDRISLPCVLLSLGVALPAAAAHLGLGRAVVVGTGLGSAIIWLVAFPQVLHGTAGLMTAEQAQAFFGRIEEMQPVNSFDMAMACLTGGLFAVGTLLALAWRHRAGPWLLHLLYAAACSAAMLALATLHVRFAAYPALAGAALLPVALGSIDTSAVSQAAQSAGRLACLAVLIGFPALAPFVALAAKKDQPTAQGCPVDGAVTLLQGHAGEVVLADVNDGPDLLYRTGVEIVGSLYHRNIDGFMRLRTAWRTIPGDGSSPGPEIRATSATLLLACPGDARSSLLEGLPNETLLDRVTENRPPAWLHRLADAGPGGYVLYQIAP